MTRRVNIMLCYPLEEKRIAKWGYPFLLQPKLDGIRCRALIQADRISLLSSEENELNHAIPHIAEAIWDRRRQLVHNGIFELDGEIYHHSLPFETITSITSRTTNRHSEYKSVEYHIFDHVCSQAPFNLRYADIESALSLSTPPLIIVPTITIYNRGELFYWMNTIESKLGYEGVILREPTAPYVRKRSTSLMKWKPKRSDQYTIVDYEEEISIEGVPKGRLGAFHVRDDYNNIFKVGSGFNDLQRRDYWERVEELIGQRCIIHYQHLTEKGVPRFPVFSVLAGEE